MSVTRAAYPTYSTAGAGQTLTMTQGGTVYSAGPTYSTPVQAPQVIQAGATGAYAFDNQTAAMPQYAQAGGYMAAAAPWEQPAGAIPSYGGYDAMSATGTNGIQAPAPQPPRRLTEGLPTPQSVEQQKQAYARALETQLESGKRTIQEQTVQAKAILQQQAEEKKMMYAIQIEEQLMQQEMSLDQQTHEKVMQLHQAAFNQKAQLEQQASSLTLEYRQKQMMEQMEQKRYEMQMKQCDMRERMQEAYKVKVEGLGPSGANFTQPDTQLGQFPSHNPAPTVPSVPTQANQAPLLPPTSYEGGQAMYGSAAQYSSAQSPYPMPQEAGSPYGIPPTQYAQPQTTMVPPPTSMGAPPTVGGH
eukprot:CAMPEP_0206477644 /NCGR_PEP_ID=MMETSP0324_2-20121206/35528_1 /ASSEMBLY_ACC=CAM_ASM_000836 /TAXON_ID=2866 /ORGANISM="Crypthecodinium cohnii, Strain Seligo" /LENGTH=357 /DNA_ID=CAMNT_0053953693 /DNA_START=109 /DNA_END=1182 /DNA_ORIENTATION=+